jgi:hypothetical protein
MDQRKIFRLEHKSFLNVKQEERGGKYGKKEKRE